MVNFFFTIIRFFYSLVNRRYVTLIGILLAVTTFCNAQNSDVSLSVSNVLSCSQLSAVISASVSCSGGITYSFRGPNSFSLVNTSGTASVTVNGTFSVTATNAAGTCSASNTILVGSSLHPDYLPLVDFYNSTGGPNWTVKTGWLTNCDPCSGWLGVTCSEGRVISLRPQGEYALGNNLDGVIPSSFGGLNKLQVLSIAFNSSLRGTLPESFSALTDLRQFLIMYTSVGGSFFDKAVGMTQLESVTTSFSRFIEPLPENIGSLFTKLKGIASFSSPPYGYTGAIPASLSAITGLEYISLDNHPLTGEIPSGLGKLSNLQNLRLTGGQLSGTIPPQLGNLINLTELILSNNQLTGSVPNSLGSLENLRYLALDGNRLTGGIPSSLSALNKLTHLELSYNQLSGPIPAIFGTWTRLMSIRLRNNQLTGNIPSGLGHLPIEYFALEYNQLTGNIPSELGNITSLKELNLQNNKLTGNIPPSLGSIGGIRGIYLFDNQLTGSIPSGFGNLSLLSALWLHNNQLSSCIPSSFTSLCGRSSVSVDIDNNLNLPSWSEFCSTGANSLATIKDGNWHDATIWSCGKVPTLKDHVTIQHNVVIPASQAGQSRKIIYGTGGRINYGVGSNLKIGQ